MRTFSALVLGLATITTAAACMPERDRGGGDDTAGDDDPTDRPDAAPPQTTQRCQKMDLLFVIDDSGSMSEEQSNLAANFPQFAQILEAYTVDQGLPLDFRVAITTSGRDVTYTQVIALPGFPPQSFTFSEQGDDGRFRQSCGMTRRWLERGDPNLASTFACAANVGTNGPGFEMQLHASELALSARVADGHNAGFLRDDALLAIVYLTDEDDCSRRDDNFTLNFDEPCTNEPVSQWVEFFDQLKGDRGRWATAVIAGPTDCTSQFGDAARAGRLLDFVAQTGENAVFASICEGNLAPALQAALDTFTAACETFPDID